MDYTVIPFPDCPTGSEGELLLFALDRVHRQFAWKSGNLDDAQLRQTHPPSTLMLGWLIKHLAGVRGRLDRTCLGPATQPAVGQGQPRR